MSNRKKSRQDYDVDFVEYDERSRVRKRAHSSSPENEIYKRSLEKKNSRSSDFREKDSRGKRRHDRDHEEETKKRKYTREVDLDENDKREKRSRRRDGSEENEDTSRMSYYKDGKDYRPRYFRHESDGDRRQPKYDASRHRNHSRYDDEGSVDYDAHRAKKSESHSTKQNTDDYWNKYPKVDNVKSVGYRYTGNSSQESKRQNSHKNFEDKENQNERDEKHRRENNENASKEGERNDSVQGSSMDVKMNESKEKVGEGTTKPSSQQADVLPAQKKTVDLLTSRTGGAYIPPAKLRMMQAQITDKSSAAYQRIAWEALKKSIHGHINKVNTGNIAIIVRELLKENIVRGRGLLCRSIIQAQAASPTFTHVYAALVAVINSKFPNIGELLLRRLVIQFRRGFKRNDKTICISASTFVAHLVNQRVAHEIVALEILTLLIESPTDDSVEVAIAFLKECGMKLMEVSNKGVHAIFEMLRNILHEGQLDKRVQYMIEVIFQVRKDEFRDHEAVLKELDLVEEEDQFTHLIVLDEAKDSEDILNVFKFDPEYEANEEKYSSLRKEILDEGSSGSENGSGSEEESDSEEESENEENKDGAIIDNTETNLVALRRTIYLTIHSSLDFEECAHKLMRMELKPGQEIELCHMFLDCCAEQRTYEKFFGLLAQRFCQINKIFIPPFQQIFKDTYDTIHRLDTNKLRNVAKFFAHLLFTDAICWEVLSFIHLNEEETTSSSRIFIKILFQELSEYMGLTKLNERVKDPTLQEAFDGLFPRDDPKNTRFAINFFTSIGLGGLTDELREHLKSQPKVPVVPKLLENLPSDSSDSETDSSDSSSDGSSPESEDDIPQKSRHTKKGKKQKSSHSKHKKKKKIKHKDSKKKKSR